MADAAPRPTVVIGTAGHIDHGKTSLLRALTGIDADRLPEAQRRGMTIDVGYAHLTLPDGTPIDFVDVPGHDRLIGNMLVGAGEIDAALLVVAADDGPRAQTLEHLAVLHALGIADGAIAITKTDLVDADRTRVVAAEVRTLVAGSVLERVVVLEVSSRTGEGLDRLRDELAALAARAGSRPAGRGGPRLAIDRAFTVKGRGLVVTGTLRGGSLAPGAVLRPVPGGGAVRVRALQVHGAAVAAAAPGRTAANVVGDGADAGGLVRGVELTDDPAVVAADRVLVALEPPPALPPAADTAGRGRGRAAPAPWPPPDRMRVRLHAATAEAGAVVGRSGRDALVLPDGRAVAVVRLDRLVALAPGDRVLLRRPAPGTIVAGGTVLDPAPARGVSRRRQDTARVARLAAAVASGDRTAIGAARLALHGVVAEEAGVSIDPEVGSVVRDALVAEVAAHHRARPAEPGIPAAALRSAAVRALRRHATLAAADAAQAGEAALAGAVAAGTLVRDADRYRLPGHVAAGPDPALLAAMERLVAALAGETPPPLATTARAARCPAEGIRALEKAGRIVVAADDLAWTVEAYRTLAARALAMSRHGPLTPAAFRDATGSSRKYVLALLEDLDRRGILRRTDDGHVPGPKAPPPPARG